MPGGLGGVRAGREAWRVGRGEFGGRAGWDAEGLGDEFGPGRIDGDGDLEPDHDRGRG